jgi:PGF-CTERM protein
MLAALALALVVGAALLAVAVPGALADRSEDPRPSHLDLREPRVAAGEVGGETAELVLDIRMDHRGSDAENVSVEVQAVSSDTGLVETTVRRDLGTVSGNREVRTKMNVSVPREGGYRISIRVYENGSRVASGGTEVRGVESLTPGYARSPIEFHRFGTGDASPPVISYAIEESTNNRTTLRTQTHLTNRGDETAGGLELVVKARQVESNVIADQERVDVGEIEPGRTATPTVTLEVPSGYNYYLDGMLLRDGVIVGTATSGAMLDPTRPVPKNQTTEDVDFDAGEFESTESPPVRDTPMGTADSVQGPGFGVVVAVLALLGVALVAARRKHE